MKRLLAIALFAASAFAQDAVTRVATDAMVLDRVAEVSKRDFPADLAKRIVEEDIDLLRGRRPDGSYQYATYERFEAGRITTSNSVQPRSDRMETIEIKGAHVYRVIVDVPARRLLVRRNRPIWLERVDIELVPENGAAVQTSSVEVKAWLQPGELRPIDLPEIARQATVKVIVTADEKGGYANVDVSLAQARIVDNADSPYAAAMTHAKALLRAVEKEELASVRTNAQRMREALGGGTTTSSTASRPASSELTVPAPADTATRIELYTALQVIEDLLTGSEREKREGLERLHQLVRRLRP